MDKIFYSEWTGELGLYRIEFFAAGAGNLVDPQMVELPEDVLVLDTLDYEFDKLPIGLAKAPVLKFTVMLGNTIDYSDEFRDLFLDSTREIDCSTIVDAGAPFKILAGTVVRLSVAGEPDYFVGIIKDETDVDIDILTGEISVEATHWLKVALDSVNFETIGRNSRILESDFQSSDEAIDLYYANGNLISNIWVQKKNGYRFKFIELSYIFKYISYAVNSVRLALLRGRPSAVFALQVAQSAVYWTNSEVNYADYGGSINDSEEYGEKSYVIAAIEKNDGSGDVGGLFNDKSAGLLKYKSAWDYLADYYESALSRAYIKGGFELRSGLLLGKRMGAMPTKEIDSDAVESGKLKLNYTMLSIVTASKQEAIGGDIGKYESSRASSRNGHEFTLPMVFGNSPVATDWERDGAVWIKKAFQPHIWDLYYKHNILGFVKVHDYTIYYLSNNKASVIYPQCVYVKLRDIYDDFTERLSDSPKTAAILIQSDSTNAKWAAETLRAVYDRQGQHLLDDAEFTAGTIDIAEPFESYYKFDFADMLQGLPMLDYMYMAMSYSFDFQTEKIKLKLLSIDENAI